MTKWIYTYHPALLAAASGAMQHRAEMHATTDDADTTVNPLLTSLLLIYIVDISQISAMYNVTANDNINNSNG